MIVIDASALLAVLLEEADAALFDECMVDADAGIMTPVNYGEALVRLENAFGPEGRELLDSYMASMSISIVAIGPDVANSAAAAAQAYGRGTPAKLNLGDCFAYALAKEENLPLLFKGDDFSKTDVVSVLA